MPNELIDLQDNEAGLRSLVGDILDEARRQGADAAEVSVNEDAGLSVSVRKGELETVEFNQDRGFGITVYYGLRKGSASTSDSSPTAIEETVRAARDIARHTQEDPCNGLADADLMPDSLPELDLYHPWPMDVGKAERLAIACEAAGLGRDERIVNSDGAQVSTQQACRVYGNSHGFIGSYLGTRHSVSCVLIAADESGMQRDYWYSLARDPGRLDDVESVGAEAARRVLARLSPRKPDTGRFPVIFSAQTSAGLAGHLVAALSGGSLYRKASFLLDSLGQSVAAPHVNVVEEPLLPGRIGSSGFDGDGVATSAKHFVEDGVVKSYVLSTYSGRKLGMPTTGNAGGVFNLLLTGRSMPVGDLYRAMGSGLLVTELMGQGVNMVTGDYSRGAAGFWIENGAIAYPVHEVTIAANLKDMLLDVQALGDDLDERGNVRTPSVLIGSMMLAGS